MRKEEKGTAWAGPGLTDTSKSGSPCAAFSFDSKQSSLLFHKKKTPDGYVFMYSSGWIDEVLLRRTQ
jgi:hypothetical protein